VSLFDIKSLKHCPSIVAASAISLVNRLKKKTEVWSDQMIAATGYDETELKPCAKDLMSLLEGLSTHNYAKNLRRKFSMMNFHEVARHKYDKKDLE
jgi:hypothetical protein